MRNTPEPQKLLTKNNGKLDKGLKMGYLTTGIHLAPANASGHNTCPMASEGCKLACLYTSGHGAYKRVQASRIKRTRFFFENREAFMAQLIKEIAGAERKAKRNALTLAIRLNLTSDVQWEHVLHEGKNIFAHFPHVQFYDYTKIIRRVLAASPAAAVPNYHLTFSRAESNQAHVDIAIANGANVAVVFAGKVLPASYLGRPVVSGDETDLRFLDRKGVVIGLTTKGRARHDQSGFVVKA